MVEVCPPLCFSCFAARFQRLRRLLGVVLLRRLVTHVELLDPWEWRTTGWACHSDRPPVATATASEDFTVIGVPERWPVVGAYLAFDQDGRNVSARSGGGERADRRGRGCAGRRRPAPRSRETCVASECCRTQGDPRHRVVRNHTRCSPVVGLGWFSRTLAVISANCTRARLPRHQPRQIDGGAPEAMFQQPASCGVHRGIRNPAATRANTTPVNASRRRCGPRG
jgi:hypothetical protein